MTKAFDRYLFGPVAAVRPYLVSRIVLFMLGMDCFMELYTRGGRYGIGGFNVAHFRLLDAIAPTPTAALYVGVVLVTGMLCIASALAGVNRVVTGLAAVLYTYAWSMSMLDSYQHHYLMSLLLAAIAFLPRLRGEDVVEKDGKPRHISAGPYVLMLVTCAVVYGFTGIAKTELEWRNGNALEHIAGAPPESGEDDAHEGASTGGQFLVATQRSLAEHGVSHDAYWRTVGHSTFLLQWFIAFGFLLAAARDRDPKNTWLMVSLAWFAAMSFHIGAELLDLRIGWFSFYMMVIASVAFLPAPLIVLLPRGLNALIRVLRGLDPKPGADPKEEPWTSSAAAPYLVPIALGGAASAVAAGMFADLPGAAGAGIVVALGVVAYALLRRAVPQDAVRFSLGVVVASGLLTMALMTSTGRFDFHRRIAGEAARRGEYRLALDSYLAAERYAPKGESRAEQIERMRARLRAQGEEP